MSSFKPLFTSALLLLVACTQPDNKSTGAPAAAAESGDAKAIAIEYAYTDIAADDAMGQQMFANKRFQVYADADFLSIKTYSTNPKPNTFDAMVISLIKDLKSNKMYTCFEINGAKYRTLEGSSEELSAQLFGQYNDPSLQLTKLDGPGATILNYNCDKWQVKQGEITTTLYTTLNIKAGPAIKALPMFVQRQDQQMGLCLGNDTTFGPNTYHLRALNIAVDQTQDITSVLAGYKEASKEEMEAELKKVLGM